MARQYANTCKKVHSPRQHILMLVSHLHKVFIVRGIANSTLLLFFCSVAYAK
jgi:hypothetical protein